MLSTDYPLVGAFAVDELRWLHCRAGLIARCNPLNKPAGLRRCLLEPAGAK